jgi:cysteine synthase
LGQLSKSPHPQFNIDQQTRFTAQLAIIHAYPKECPMKAPNILATIGNTPHVRVNRLFGQACTSHHIYIKSERSNPGGSIKDRIAVAMVEAAEKSGVLKPGATIIEPTSGNTGVGLAVVAAVKGYKLVLVMPESMSIERRRLMLAYGASFDLTPREKGMNGAIARAKELVSQTPGAWMPQQFENPANIDVHVQTTAEEILADFPNGVDYLITGVGTGGHITGVAQVLKAKFPAIKVFAVEPAASPVISGGKPSPHPIQGIGAGFIPANLHVDLLDGVIQVEGDAAKDFARRSAAEEGMLVGISSGATLAAIAQKLPEIPTGSTVLGFNYDTGERYLSVEGFLP